MRRAMFVCMSFPMSRLFTKQARRSSIRAGLLLSGLLSTRTVAAAPPIIVGDGAPTACTEAALKDALFIASVRGGGTIKFNCGDAPATLTVSPLTDDDPFGLVVFIIPNNTTIDGGGVMTIQGTTGKTTLLVAANSTASLTHISLTRANLAPAIINRGTLTLRDTTIAHNGANANSEVVQNLGTLMVHDSTLSDNVATGVIFSSGTLTVTRSSFLNSLDGSGIANFGTAEVTRSVFSGNTGEAGAGIFNTGTLTVEHCEFSGNAVEFDGGAILNTGTLLVATSIFSNNQSIIGAGAIGGSATIEHSEFVGNHSEHFGGALGGTSLVIRHSLFTGNSAGDSGGAILAADATLTNSTITGNVAGVTGGGIYMNGGIPPVLIHTSVTDNTPNDIVVQP